MRSISVKVVCFNCGKEFDVERYRAKRAKYCSVYCNLNVINKARVKTGTYVKCWECGKEIYQAPSKRKILCSKQCLGLYFAKVRKGVRLNTGKSCFTKGFTPWNKGKHTGIAPWLGKKRSEEDKKKMSENRKGLTAGENSPHWKGGITPQILIDRATFRKTIRKQVLERDNYTCQTCGTKGGYLHIDHIQPWKEYTEGRFDINNCRTLCRKCHYFVTYGKEISENSMWGVFKKGGNYLRN